MNPVVDWSYEFTQYTATEVTDDKIRRKEPKFITTDPTNNQVFYLSGRYEGKASVMKFSKKQGNMNWWTSFNSLTHINAIIEVPNNSIFYGCGDYDVLDSIGTAIATTTYTAGIFKMDNDGSVKWMMTISGTNPVTTSKNQDRCFGLTIDNEKTGSLTALLQVKMKEVRSNTYNPGDYYDTVLMRFDNMGTVLSSI